MTQGFDGSAESSSGELVPALAPGWCRGGLSFWSLGLVRKEWR